MKIFINIVFILVMIFNISKRKQNILNANIPTVSILAALILSIVGLLIWYSKDNTILGIVTLMNAVLFFLSFYIAIGISDRYFNSFMARSIVILSVPFDQAKNIMVKKNKKRIKLIIKAHGHDFLQEYDLSLEDEIISFLYNNFMNSMIEIEENY